MMKRCCNNKKENMTLYHSPASPNSRITLLVARNLKININVREINLAEGEQYQEWYLKINPQHAVPCLDDSGHVISESRAIAMYMANKRSCCSSIYPHDAKKRSVIDQRLFFDQGTIFATLNKITGIAYSGGTSLPDDLKQQSYDVFKSVNDFLLNSKWVAGDSVTIADLAFLSTISSFVHIGALMDDYPELQRWYDQCKTLPGWEENEMGAQIFGASITDKIEKGF